MDEGPPPKNWTIKTSLPSGKGSNWKVDRYYTMKDLHSDIYRKITA